MRISAVIDDLFQSYYSTSNVWMSFDHFYQQLELRLQLQAAVLDSVIQQKLLAQDLVVVTDRMRLSGSLRPTYRIVSVRLWMVY